jgi:uncharacterized membrane protein
MRLVLEPGYRLFTGFVVAVLTFLLSGKLPHGIRIILAWDAGVAVLLGLIAIMMCRSDPDETRRRAQREETSNLVVLLTTIVVVVGALAFIAYALPKSNSMSGALRNFHIFQSIAGVFLAWLLIHTIYALHYAKLYYSIPHDSDPNTFAAGLVFPGDKVVDYWDFVYYSATIAMCFQTSDVSIIAPKIRRLTIFHATVSYFFALVILGMLLDIISNIIGR